MKITRTVEVLVETREITAIKATAPSEITKWCRECNQEVSMVAPEIAAELASVTPRTIYTWVEAERVHFEEAADGSVLICRRSLGAKAELMSPATVRPAIDV